MLLKFTDYETGKPVLINPADIIAAVPRPAIKNESTGQEEGERVRIDYRPDWCVLVRESIDEVLAMLEKLNSHASLVAALRAAREELYDLGFDSGSTASIARRDEIYAQIDAALAGEAGE